MTKPQSKQRPKAASADSTTLADKETVQLAEDSFENLGLNDKLLKALKHIGYESPSPIQRESIPSLLEGRDILGQAQTGTGKTAAFALPILQQINLRQKSTQAMVMAPTRELAIQVAEAFQSYAHYLPSFHVLPIYGGQGYEGQIRALKRGVQLVVGTPGRIMDHMRKGTLKLDKLKHLVLDEADEMLRMGFIDDVEWVMSQLPEKRQIALFSATMPKEIAKVANTYLQEPVHVKIKQKTTTAATITQRYWPVGGLHKLDALTRILEADSFEAMIVFVRTKTATVELTEKLEARGYRASALNGDISQHIRERTVERLKAGKIDILVATDVAARGLDVERISHVLNYDIPYDTEAYVHRIGRTGRAGRKGEAILFVAKREMRMLRSIEKATGKEIERMTLPSTQSINEQRIKKFKQGIVDTIENDDISFFGEIIESCQLEFGLDTLKIAAALAKLYQGEQPFLLEDKPIKQEKREFREKEPRERKKGPKSKPPANIARETYRLEVGANDGIGPGNIIGAIANEADIESQYIGKLVIKPEFSLVDLPAGMPKEVFQLIKKARVGGKQLRLSLANKKARGNKENREKGNQEKENRPKESREKTGQLKKRKASPKKNKKKNTGQKSAKPTAAANADKGARPRKRKAKS